MSKQKNYFKVANKLDMLRKNKQRVRDSLARRRSAEDTKREKMEVQA